ncbi:MAG: MBG domain-containing protein [Luteolibacter sp.]
MHRSIPLILARCLASVPCFIALAAEAAQTPATVTFSNLVQTYNGTSKTPTVTTSPANLAVQVTYRDLSPSPPAPVSQVVYNDTPDPLALSYFAYGFQANQLSALGNLVQLGGTARKLSSGEVILVTHAKQADYSAWIAANPSKADAVGYLHPITLTFYEVNSANQFVFLTSATQDIRVPWRPLVDPTTGNTPYPHSGYAFRASVPFPSGIILPEKVLVMVSFRTTSYGFTLDPANGNYSPSPIGTVGGITTGPYDSLNVAKQTTTNVVQVGSDLNPDVVMQVKDSVWYYPSSGWTGTSAPIIRVNALSTDSITPPVNAGSWTASAKISNPDYLGTASSTFTIQQAAASIQLGNLSQTYNGSPKSASATTTPTGVAFSLTYNSSSTPPTSAGTYAVVGAISDANYSGPTTTGSLEISKANAVITLGNLTQVANGTAKTATVTSTPPGVATTTTYNGSASAPSALGKYAVHAVIANPNYQGPAADGELWLGNNLSSWLSPWVLGNQIPGTATGDQDDPDKDSISNLLEYALALDPSTANHGIQDLGIPRAEYSNGQLSLTYRKNLTATDLNFKVESTTALQGAGAWSQAVTTDSIVSSVGSVQTIRATLTLPPNEPVRFMRLNVTRNAP